MSETNVLDGCCHGRVTLLGCS